jgi:hypothetical protein
VRRRNLILKSILAGHHYAVLFCTDIHCQFVNENLFKLLDDRKFDSSADGAKHSLMYVPPLQMINITTAGNDSNETGVRMNMVQA